MNVLFLTHRLPYAPNRGDRIRAYYQLRALSRFARVSLFSLVHDEDEEARAQRIEFAAAVATARVSRVRNAIRGAFALPGSTPLTHVLLDAPGARRAIEQLSRDNAPDVVLAFCSGMARFALESPLDRIPFVLDMVDVDSMKWKDLSESRSFPMNWVFAREARTLAAFERLAVSRARMTLVVNEKERDALVSIGASGPVTVVPVGVEFAAYAPTTAPAVEPRLVFVGVMDYFPNDEGVRWFLGEIWPKVRAKKPGAVFSVVGRGPTAALRSLAATVPGVEVVGEVDDVQPHLHRAAISVVPLRLARGLQTKVLEALAAGLPVVTTGPVSRGLPDSVRAGCIETADADGFAAAVIRLLDLPPDERRTMASKARLQDLSWENQLAPLEQILKDAAATRETPKPQPIPQ